MYYTVRHLTRYRYSAPVHESVMQLYMQPRTEALQHCFTFETHITPPSHVLSNRDAQGNLFHSFNIPASHSTMTILTHSVVEVQNPPPLPDRLTPADWEAVDALGAAPDLWEALAHTPLTEPTERLQRLAAEIDARRRDDPLTVVLETMTRLYNALEYRPQSTQVDSPIDVALENRAGVCQDFSHIMLSMLREVQIPCRYVSGYLAHQDGRDRSAQDATHAWVDVYLPGIGWFGCDPTNNVIAADHHIRVALGRDYSDVPPSRGVFKGQATSELNVAVQVTSIDDPASLQKVIALPENARWLTSSINGGDESTEAEELAAQRAAQQQQQQ